MEKTPGVSAGPRTPRLTQGLPHKCTSPLDRKMRQWTTPRGPRTRGKGRGGESQGGFLEEKQNQAEVQGWQSWSAHA